MEQLVAKILESARVQVLIFLFLLAVVALPTLMAYRIELAVNRLADRLECGSKINIANKGAQNGS